MANEKLDPAKVEKFMERLVGDLATTMHGALSYMGDKLGLFKAMSAAGPVTIDELAQKTGYNARYVREWLAGMVAAEYITLDSQSGKYTLPPEHAAPLADEEFPFFVGGFLGGLCPQMAMAPKVAEAFRTGKGVPQSEYPPEMFEGIERVTAPWYKHHLVQEWIPAMPQAKAKLEAGGTALDVGCGSGRAAIILAKAFPKARILGFDHHEASIERARANARAEGVADHVRFDVVDGTRLPHAEFDLITTFDVVHDAVDPVALMTSIRKALAKDGTYLMLEVNVSGKPEENINPIGKLIYACSMLYCMTTSLAHGGAGIGAAMGEPKARELAAHAGFSHFRRLPIEDPFCALYELRA